MREKLEKAYGQLGASKCSGLTDETYSLKNDIVELKQKLKTIQTELEKSNKLIVSMKELNKKMS